MPASVNDLWSDRYRDGGKKFYADEDIIHIATAWLLSCLVNTAYDTGVYICVGDTLSFVPGPALSQTGQLNLHLANGGGQQAQADRPRDDDDFLCWSTVRSMDIEKSQLFGREREREREWACKKS